MTEKEYMYATGRIVSGNPFKQQPDKKDPTTGIVKEGGWFVGIAVPKTDPAGSATKAQVEAIAKEAWPNGEWGYPTFSLKIKDGDMPPQNGKVGYPGHWVFSFQQSWPFTVYTAGATSQLTDPKSVKKGDYVRVPFTSKGNGAKTSANQTPGVYLNAALIEFVGYGEAIMSGPDPASVMAAIGQAVVPQGASATPVASGPPLTPPPQAAAPPVITPQATTPPVAAAPPQATGIVPAPDFLNPPVMTDKAAGASYQQFIDQGWTKEQLIAQGYMNP